MHIVAQHSSLTHAHTQPVSNYKDQWQRGLLLAVVSQGLGDSGQGTRISCNAGCNVHIIYSTIGPMGEEGKCIEWQWKLKWFYRVTQPGQQQELGIKSNLGSLSLLYLHVPADMPSEGGVTGQAMSVLNWQICLMFYWTHVQT